METNQTNTNTESKSNFLVQGSILAIAGIIVRLIGMIYRIPFIRIVGDEGNGYYSVAFEIYNIVLILSSYAFPTAISKLISARISQNDYKSANKILQSSLIYATIIGALGCLFIVLTADWFANSFFMLPNCKYALLALAPTIWIMAYLGVFRGFYQGQSTMVPTALSQILEQVVNAIISVAAASFFYNAAIKLSGSDSFAAAKGAMGGTIGTGAGALTALIVLLVLYYKTKARWKVKVNCSMVEPMSGSEVSKLLLITIVPVVLSQVVYNINTILDSKFFSNIMITTYCLDPAEVASQYGVFTGRFKTMINIPVAISNSLGLSLIPALSAAIASGDNEKANDGISQAMRYISMIAMPASVGLTVLGGPVIGLIFGESDMATKMTIIGSFAILFTSISTVTNAVLHGSNNMNKPVIHSIISLVIHIAALLFMLNQLHLGVYSLPIANLIFALCMTILNALSIKKDLGYKQEWMQTFIKPLICSVVMGAVAYLVRVLVEKYISTSNFVITVICVLVAVVVYVIMILLTKCLTKEELKKFPVINKIVK